MSLKWGSSKDLKILKTFKRRKKNIKVEEAARKTHRCRVSNNQDEIFKGETLELATLERAGKKSGLVEITIEKHHCQRRNTTKYLKEKLQLYFG